MAAQSRYCDKKYLNWLKSTLSLLYLKKGIESVVDNEAKCFHDDLQIALGVYGSAPNLCPTCTSRNISPDYRRRMWHMSCRLCYSWLQQILLNHVNKHMPKLNPVNTDPQLWPTSEYEVCKVFMPYGCQQNMSAKDGDIQSLLSLIKNCIHFKGCGRVGRMDLIDDLLRIRNSRFHSGDCTVDDADVQVDMQTVIDFLQGLTNLSAPELQAVQEALDQITKLQTGILDVSINKELELHALQAKQHALATELKRLEKELNEHKEQTKETVTLIQTDVDIYKTKLSEVDAELNEHKEHTSATEDTVTLIQTDVDIYKTKLSEVDAELNEHKEQTSATEDTVKLIQTDVDIYKTKLSEVDAELNEHKEQTSATEDTVKLIQTDVDIYKTKLSEVDAELNEHKEQTSATEDTVRRIQTNFDIYTTKLSEVDAETQNLQLRATTTETDLTTLTAKTKNLEQSIQELKEVKVQFNKFLQTNDLEQDMPRLSTGLQNHEERIKSLETQSPNLHEHHAVTQSNLRKTLMSLYERNFRKIPVFDEIIVDLEDLYVGQEMKIINQSAKFRVEKKSAEQPDKDYTTIKAIEDIFYNDGKICEHVLISSEPGLGKSTFCKFIVRQWYKGHTLDEIILTKCQRVMREFKLLFFIDLKEANIERNAPTSDEIATVVYEQLELTDICSISDIRKCLSEPSTLVVMDSLDELSSTRYPRRGKHNQSCMVTTSRPWKIEALRSQLTDVDQHIEIVGLAKESATTLADNVLKLINEGSSQMKTGVDFIREMKKKGLQHFLNMPLLLMQMLGLWFSGESFGNSQFEIYSKVTHHQICIAVKTKSLPNNVGKGFKQVFPFCDKTEQCLCRDYGELMWKVAQLAYHTLFNKDRHMCLVFDHEVTNIYGLSTEEVELCLKIGILTQHKLLVKNPIEKKKNVRFPHKTYQEYFASICLSRQNDGQISNLDHIRSVTCNLDQALELDKVLLFCSQLDRKSNANATRQLSYLISVKADEDPRVQEYRQSCNSDGAPHVDLIRKIQKMISTATQQNAVLFLSDLILISKEWRENLGDTIDLRRLDMTGVKSIHVKCDSVTADQLVTLKQCQNLQKMVIFVSGINVKNIHEMLARNRDTLLTLGLGGDWFVRQLDLSSLGKKLIETFSEKLSSLSLRHVNLSHQQCQQLSEFVSSSHRHSWLPFSSPRTTAHNLREVALFNIHCTHWFNIGTCLKLDLTMHENLHTVKLCRLGEVKVNLNPLTLQKIYIYLPFNLSAQAYMIQCLPAARHLRELTCYHIRDCQQLATVLPQLHSLRRLVMGSIDFSCLSQSSLTSTMKQLEYVELSDCTITDGGLRSLIRSLTGQHVEVVIWTVTVTGGDECLDDIQQSSTIEVVGYGSVKKKEDGWELTGMFYNNPLPSIRSKDTYLIRSDPKPLGKVRNSRTTRFIRSDRSTD